MTDRCEHLFQPVKGQTGCARCGYARGHHPTAATLRREARVALRVVLPPDDETSAERDKKADVAYARGRMTDASRKPEDE